MSGPGIHHIIAREFLDKRLQANFTDSASVAFWNEMKQGEFAPAYYLGAQGADFLFFNVNDWPSGGAIKPLAKVYYEVEEFIQEFVEKLKKMIPEEVWTLISTLESLAANAVERSVLLSEISSILTDVQNNIDALNKLVETKIQDYIVNATDYFELLSHPQQDGQKYSEWWWFDTLHIRRTGQFLKELLMNSAENSMERAYALGYLTHYTSDVVGHAYVNGICGGPYRTHGHRHKVVENHHDVWAYNQYIGGEFIKSKLGEQYLYNGKAEMPDSLKEFILKCIQSTYYDKNGPLYGKEIKLDDIDVAYKTWIRWFMYATDNLDLPIPKAYSLTAEIKEAWDKFTDNVGGIGNWVGSSLSGQSGIIGFFEALAALIAGPILLAGALVDYVAGSVTTLGAAPMRYLLSLSYEALYNAFMNFRHGVTLSGFAYPTVSGLNHYMVNHMMNTGSNDIFNHNAKSLVMARAYPALKTNIPGLKKEQHLVYPFPFPANLEKDITTGFPFSYFNKTPEWYMTNEKNHFGKNIYNYFKEFNESKGPNPTADEVNNNYKSLSSIAADTGLGNGVDFSFALYKEFIELGNKVEYPDFVLDSDRGFAFKSWRKVMDISLVNTPLNDPAQTNVPIKDKPVKLEDMVPNTLTDIIDAKGGVL
jgi:hypothetical protein